MRMTNRRNRSIYRLWAPVYDGVLGWFFAAGRHRAVQALGPRAGERVLLLGVGTGADLPLLPRGVLAMGVDISPQMLARALAKVTRCAADIVLVEADAQGSPYKAASFDAAILNLILSVIPDPRLCLQSALQAVKPGGRIVIFDKFLPDDAAPSHIRRLLNVFSTAVGTDINRSLGPMLRGLPCHVAGREPSVGGGLYQVVLLERHDAENEVD